MGIYGREASHLCILYFYPLEEQAKANVVMISSKLPIEALSVLKKN
jgi:hypothetical protein